MSLPEDRAQLDEFISSVSHNLRTPLAAIKASVGVVLANEPKDLPEPLHRMLVNIDFAADELADMVANLVELARLQSKPGVTRSEWHDLRGLVHRAAEVFGPVAKRQNQVLEIHVPRAPVEGYCYAAGVQRVLLNLLSNAHKFARTGTTIRLSLEKQKDQVIFAVADEGPGIDPVDSERIFQRSYRSSMSGAPGNTGAGLGLPVARAIAELHGGSVWVESRPGEGATFRLSFALKPTARLEGDVSKRTSNTQAPMSIMNSERTAGAS